jgi:hypothetical protein
MKKDTDSSSLDHPLEWWATYVLDLTDPTRVEQMLKANSPIDRNDYVVQAIATARFCMAKVRSTVKALLKEVSIDSITQKEPQNVLQTGILSAADRKIIALLGNDAFSYFFSDPTASEVEHHYQSYADTQLRLERETAISSPSINDGIALRKLAEALVFARSALQKIAIPTLREHPKFQKMLEHIHAPHTVIQKGLRMPSEQFLPQQ